MNVVAIPLKIDNFEFDGTLGDFIKLLRIRNFIYCFGFFISRLYYS